VARRRRRPHPTPHGADARYRVGPPRRRANSTPAPLSCRASASLPPVTHRLWTNSPSPPRTGGVERPRGPSADHARRRTPGTGEGPNRRRGPPKARFSRSTPRPERASRAVARGKIALALELGQALLGPGQVGVGLYCAFVHLLGLVLLTELVVDLSQVEEDLGLGNGGIALELL
jgi:hypothetical protein